MWRYLSAAFMVRVRVPAIGAVPVNLLGAIAFATLGVVNPGFWFLGAGVEAAVLTSLAFNRRFQNLTDSLARRQAGGEIEQKRAALAGSLPPASRDRLRTLSSRCSRVLELYEAASADAFVLASNREALSNLEWIFLKLLVADANLRSHTAADSDATLTRRIGELEADLRGRPETEVLRQSKASTLSLLQQRLALWRRRGQSLEEIASDLSRVEAQVDLLLENAALEGRPNTINLEIELATDLVGGVVFGDAESTVADIERTFSRPRAAAAARQAADTAPH
jgi:hypothetical protein